MDLTLLSSRGNGAWWPGKLAGPENFGYRNIRFGIGESGIIVRFITAAVPDGLLRGADFMERKRPLRESGAEQNKSAASTTFGTNSDCCIGKSRKSLPEIATVGAKQGDVDARDQRCLRVALGCYCVRRKLMRPMGR